MTGLRAHPRYPWLVAFTAFLSFALTVGITQYAFGVFVAPLEEEFGWSRAQVMGTFSLLALSGVAALPTGWLLDRFGVRPVMAVALLMLAVSHLLRPLVTELWHFYALSALQFAASPGSTVIAGARLVGMWFDHHRGRAMGITATGANVGGMVFSVLTAVLVGWVGWRTSYFVYGLLFAALIPMVLLIVRERPARTVVNSRGDVVAAPAETGLQLSDVLRLRVFYLVAIGLVLAQLTYQVLLPQLQPHLENVGIETRTAALGLSVLAFFGVVGKVVLGAFCDRYPARYALLISLTMQITGIAILLLAGSSRIVWVFVPVFGFGFGSLGAIMPLLVQETFGLRSFGTIFGTLTFLTVSTALVAPPLVGASFDATGSYQLAFTIVGGLFVVAAISIALTRPVMRRLDGGIAEAPPAP